MDNSNNEEKLNYIKNSLQELAKEGDRITEEMNKIIDTKQFRTEEGKVAFEKLALLSAEITKKAVILTNEWVAAIKKI